MSLLSGESAFEGLTVDTELRWTFVKALAALGAADEAELQAELDRDPTSTGRERHAEALAARPTAEAKADAWAKAVEQNDLPNQMVEAVSAGFRRSTDLSLLEPYIEQYHAMLVDAWDARSVAMGERVVGGFYPFGAGERGSSSTPPTPGWPSTPTRRPASCAPSPRTATPWLARCRRRLATAGAERPGRGRAASRRPGPTAYRRGTPTLRDRRTGRLNDPSTLSD